VPAFPQVLIKGEPNISYICSRYYRAPELIFGDLWQYDPAPETADPKLKARYGLFIADLLDLDRCPVLVPALAPAFDVARTLAARLGDSDIALTATAGGLDVSVKAERKIITAELPKLAGLARELDLARLSVNGEVVVMPRVPLVQMGKAMVPIPPVSFLQATAAGEDVLGTLVCDGLGKARSVADLFSGCGPFTFRIAERARVRAFDSDRPAIAALIAAQRTVR